MSKHKLCSFSGKHYGKHVNLTEDVIACKRHAYQHLMTQVNQAKNPSKRIVLLKRAQVIIENVCGGESVFEIVKD